MKIKSLSLIASVLFTMFFLPSVSLANKPVKRAVDPSIEALRVAVKLPVLPDRSIQELTDDERRAFADAIDAQVLTLSLADQEIIKRIRDAIGAKVPEVINQLRLGRMTDLMQDDAHRAFWREALEMASGFALNEECFVRGFWYTLYVGTALSEMDSSCVERLDRWARDYKVEDPDLVQQMQRRCRSLSASKARLNVMAQVYVASRADYECRTASHAF